MTINPNIGDIIELTIISKGFIQAKIKTIEKDKKNLTPPEDPNNIDQMNNYNKTISTFQSRINDLQKLHDSGKWIVYDKFISNPSEKNPLQIYRIAALRGKLESGQTSDPIVLDEAYTFDANGTITTNEDNYLKLSNWKIAETTQYKYKSCTNQENTGIVTLSNGIKTIQIKSDEACNPNLPIQDQPQQMQGGKSRRKQQKSKKQTKKTNKKNKQKTKKNKEAKKNKATAQSGAFIR